MTNRNNVSPPSVVSVGQALLAMRNAPYSTESALAELIDNSIQAEAEYISVIINEDLQEIKGNLRNRLDSIAVFDNGYGMDPELIQNCLSVGFSRNRQDPEGLGRFGYGMLIGSLSQSFRVEVYSWKKGKPINYVYIDIEELLETNSQTIPPIQEVNELPLTKNLKNDAYLNSESGTLVVLKNLDYQKIGVVTGEGLYDRMSLKLGRIYRHYLDDDDTYGKKRTIEIMTKDSRGNISLRNPLIPNDPLYLLTPNMLTEDVGIDFSKESTNMIFDRQEITVEYEVIDENYQPTGEFRTSVVEINSTFIKPNVRAKLNEKYKNAGSSALGKMYDKNTGISFMRSAREIKLDTQAGFVNTYDPTERWWGIEVRFKPELDEIFGVSADKQHIQNIFHIDSRTSKSYFESEDESLSVKFNIQFNKVIKDTLAELRKLVSKSGGSRPPKRGENSSTIENKANNILKKDKTPTKSAEIQKGKTDEEKLAELKTVYSGMNPDKSEEEIEDLAKKNIDLVTEFIKEDWAGTTFLDHKQLGNGSAAIINMRTVFYKNFYEVLENMEDSTGENALKLLLMAYIRTEDELSQKHDPEGELFDEFRNRWGHWVNELMPLVKD
tara:strand:+ start:1014 stop:2840 length:1827 start_codon:yes stop_codon:yes gene_type:complete